MGKWGRLKLDEWRNIMSEFNRGIMKFDDADSPLAVALSAIFVLGIIGGLLWWGYQIAYI